MTFVHLHVHSSYSVLDGFGKPEDLVARAKALGMPALALTDHGTMFGSLSFFSAAQAAGIKPIIGLETYLAPRGMQDRDAQKDRHPFHLVLLAENMEGYRNLLKIASTSQLEGFYSHPRIDKAYLAEHAAGLIGSSACLSGELPRAIVSGDGGQVDRALAWYREVFGPEHFYLELQSHNLPDQERVNQGLVALARKTGMPLIATNDVHYIRKEDAELQDILLCVQTGKRLADHDRMRMSDDSYYLRSPHEMSALFTDVPDALQNTLAIAERCDVDLTRKSYHLPLFELPEGVDPATHLEALCQAGLERNIPGHNRDADIQQRLKYELGIINQMGFAEYFLIVWDLCRFSREQNIWYNVRGSGNGSLVAFALDITSVEPLEHQLMFERFLNPDRVTMPDIDLDFQDDRRAEVMEYCNRKYGADKVAQIITFNAMNARGAIRDVGRVMDIPLPEVDRVAKAVPGPSQGIQAPISECLKTTPDLKAMYDSSEQIKKLIDTAGRMEGSIRNVGTHAAGVIISDKPLTEYLPLHRPTSQSEDLPIKSVSQYDMKGINELGLLKVDFLGLVTLTIMARATEYIAKRHGIRLNLRDIPTDEPEVFKFLGEGHTTGVFQLESTGMTRFITQMQPTKLSHVIAMVALYRPGPMEIIPKYIANMHGELPVEYQHPKLKPILEETYGHAVYQEQIMTAAIQLGGYTPGESDDLRSAISKKKEKEVKKHHAKFIKGAMKNGIDQETAESIFKHWEAFAHYGFNKGHATNYGMIAVKTAYLKSHYPVEYMTALLSAWKNDADKCARYVAESREMGLEVLPPDVNFSEYDFSIEDLPEGKSAIRFGLGAVKNVGQNPVDIIVQARNGRPFTDINDFVRRVDLRSVQKRPLECLIKVGALDSLGPRQALLMALDQMVNISGSYFRAAGMGQMDLFGGAADGGGMVQLRSGGSLDKKQELDWEKELLGLYVSEHPLRRYMSLINDKLTHFSNTLSEIETETKVAVGGVIKKVRPYLTKKGDYMGFATIEDQYGEIDLVLFVKTWQAYNAILDPGALVIVRGNADAREQGVSVKVDSITRVETDGLGESFSDSRFGGPDFELMLEKFLPNMRVLSRYAYNDSVQPDVADEEETRNDLEESFDYIDEDGVGMEEGSSGGVAWEEMTGVEAEGLEAWAPEVEDVPDPAADENPPREETGGASPSLLAGFTAEAAAAEPAMTVTVVETVVAENTTFSMEPQVPRKLLIIHLDGENDIPREYRKLNHIHGLLISRPGDMPFSFQFVERDEPLRIVFPNDRTHWCEELRQQLIRLVGEDNLEIEEY